MNILIISYYLAPANLMGAVRPSSLAVQWDRMGHDVTILTSKRKSWLFLERTTEESVSDVFKGTKVRVLQQDSSKVYRSFSWLIWRVLLKLKIIGIGGRSNGGDLKAHTFFGRTKKIIFWTLSLLQDLDWALYAGRSISKSKRKISEFDLVFSTFGPLSSHLVPIIVGSELLKNWVCDFRDPLSLPHDTRLQSHVNSALTRLICNRASIITAVSQGYAEMISKCGINKCINVVYNGYNAVDIPLDFEHCPSRFRTAYAGTTYGGKRDLAPLLKALQEMSIMNRALTVEFAYAGPEGSLVEKMIQKYSPNVRLLNYGSVPREEVFAIYNSSDLLVVATWNDEDYRGVIPGKTFELMAFNKPILCLVNSAGGYIEIEDLFKGIGGNAFVYDSTRHGWGDILRFNSTIYDKGNVSSISYEKYSYKNIANEILSLCK
jgi:glycosyltransferase involved in cell wall biosynthesis